MFCRNQPSKDWASCLRLEAYSISYSVITVRRNCFLSLRVILSLTICRKKPREEHPRALRVEEKSKGLANARPLNFFFPVSYYKLCVYEVEYKRLLK